MTSVELAPRYETDYQSVVKPERVVVIPGYALRLLRHGDLSPKEMSLWVAFHQAVYWSWRNDGGNAKAISENIPHQDIIKYAMMGRASFFREVTGQQSICGGLVEAEEPQSDPYASRRIANALRYKVSMAPRLTKRDIGVIQAVLEKAVAGHEGEQAESLAEKALAELLSQNPGAYLDDQRAQIAEVEGWPRTLAEVVRRVIGAKTLPGLLRKAADNLQERILVGYGNVVITHYFLMTAAPALGLSHAQAWTVIALRDRVWYDYNTGERWPFAIVRGGLDELAAMTGSSVKSVRRWFDEPGFGAFVSLQAAPVELPEYWDARAQVFYVEPLELVIIPGAKTANRDKMITDTGQNEHRYGTKRAPIRDKMSTDTGQNEHPLNNFYKHLSFNNRRQQNVGKSETRFSAAADLNFSENPSPDREPAQPEPPKPAASPKYWGLRELVKVNTVNRKKLAEMEQAGTDARALAQWLVEAHRKTGLTNPTGFAVQNAIEYPDGKGLRESIFARRSKSYVLGWLSKAIAGYPLSDAPDVTALLRGISKPNLRNLFLALGGSEEDIPAAYVPPAPQPRAAAAAEPVGPVQIPEDIRRRGEEIVARIRRG